MIGTKVLARVVDVLVVNVVGVAVVISFGIVAGIGCGFPTTEDAPFVRDAALDAVQLQSAPGKAESHENGKNCMACHSAASDAPERSGPGLFTVAMSLWTEGDAGLIPVPPGARLELRTAPAGAGDLVASILADDLGNAYTTEAIDFFAAPLFPSVFLGETTLAMPFPTESGACNMCHFPGGIEVAFPRPDEP